MKKKTSGWIFIIIQLIAYVSCLFGNSLSFDNIFNFIGFNCFVIIGIILLVKDSKSKE